MEHEIIFPFVKNLELISMPLHLHCIYKALDYRPYKIIVVTESRAFKFSPGARGDEKKNLLYKLILIRNKIRTQTFTSIIYTM